MIRKGTALLLSALLLASAMPFAVSAEEVSAKTTEYVNFRTGPGTNYSSKGVIPSGTGITVTDTSNSQWYAVRLSDGSTGYHLRRVHFRFRQQYYRRRGGKC